MLGRHAHREAWCPSAWQAARVASVAIAAAASASRFATEAGRSRPRRVPRAGGRTAVQRRGNQGIGIGIGIIFIFVLNIQPPPEPETFVHREILPHVPLHANDLENIMDLKETPES